MKASTTLRTCACLLTALLGTSSAQGQDLFSEDFDADHSTDWYLHDGAADEFGDFFFDYSTMGIPSAPNSTGGTTRGMRISAAIFEAVFAGSHGSPTVSPIPEDYEGDYKITFDWWINYIGKFLDPNIPGDTGGVGFGTSGSTMLSTFGLLSSGTANNWPGASDGVFFAVTGDGGSGADYRAYSSERAISYQLPHLNPETDVDPMGQPIDSHATYLADSRNNTAALYSTNFGGATVPAGQTSAVIDGAPMADTQYGTTPAGSMGFEWHEVEISKAGNLISWKVDDIELITLDIANFNATFGGTNIFFGHADISAGISVDPNYPAATFSLYDNIKVTPISATTEDADFNGDDFVDGADFLIWQANLGTGTTLAAGDANGDMVVNDLDLAIWSDQFGSGGMGGATAVPEPAAGALVLAALTALLGRGRRRPSSI